MKKFHLTGNQLDSLGSPTRETLRSLICILVSKVARDALILQCKLILLLSKINKRGLNFLTINLQPGILSDLS